MATPAFVLPARVKGFHNYFEFTAETGVILAQLGYGFGRAMLTLPQSNVNGAAQWAEPLQKRILLTLQRVAMVAEATRREFLLAPILFDVSVAVDAELHSEYAVNVSPQLRGQLDFYLEKQSALLVVEAKNADMARGFTQLAAELIALDNFAAPEIPTLYGVVSVGDVWRFGVLDRARKHITQDIRQFTLPDDLPELLSTLTGILANVPERKS